MRKLSLFLALLLLILILLALFNRKKVKRLLIVNTFFDEENIVDNFQDADDIFPSTDIPPSANKLIIPERLDFSFPPSFTHLGRDHQTEDFLKNSMTEGLIVIHQDTIVYEDYTLGLQKDEKHISWSMSKSFIGTLLGIVVEQGLLNLDDKVKDHLPEFSGTGYEDVTVEHLLQMRSGVRFNEDYGDYNSDINRFGRAFALGTSYKKFAQSLVNEIPPGSQCRYVSIDTQMLGFLISKVTGKSLTELLGSYMWGPMGMEHSGGWIIDNTDFEMALGGMTATLRDFAKLGLLYLHKGKLNGHQIVSEEWIKSATSRHTEDPSPHSATGYGYQWWIPSNDTGDFYALGIYDQFVYVNPKKELVIAKLSADHNFKFNGPRIKAKHVSFFQDVAQTF